MYHQVHLQRVDLLGVTGDVFGRQRELGIIEERREAQAVAVEVRGQSLDHNASLGPRWEGGLNQALESRGVFELHDQW